MRCVWGEYTERGALWQGFDCFFVGIGIRFVIRRVGREGCVEVIIDSGDIFSKMLAFGTVNKPFGQIDE